jgi:Cu(I)/Ag(I) efflux system membrane fusion protein
MHPWIKSDKPGRCTICGMDLAPVYEGDAGIADVPGRVNLGTNAIQVLHVASAPVATNMVARRLTLSGTVDDDESNHRVISAPFDARIEKLDVASVGVELAAGARIAVVYSPSLLAAEREFSTLHRARAAGESPSQASGTDRLLLAARQRLLQMGQLPVQIDALPAKDPGLDTSELLAVAGGTVVMKSAFPGQYVKEGDRLLETADLTTMWVQLVAYESDLPWLRPGRPVSLRVDSVPDVAFSGRVDFIDPNLDPATRSTRIRVVVANPPVPSEDGPRRLLRHRVTARADVEVGFEALSVPRSAVLRGGGPAVVYVDHGAGSFERREIRVGRVGDQRLEVLGGLDEGERVVVEGALMIDAQAQLNRPAESGKEPEPVSGAAAGQGAAPPAGLMEWFRLSDRIAAALADSDLSAFRKETAHLEHLRSDALASLGGDSEVLRRAIEAVPKLPDGEALSRTEEARRWFVGFGRASAVLVGEARSLGFTVPFRIYQCPMVSTAFPGAPKRAVWIQAGAEVRNPYFGSAMPDCGTELREVR